MAEKEDFFENEIETDPQEEWRYIVPRDEYRITHSRSSGKGGQRRDKVSTRAILTWNVFESKMSPEKKERVIEKAGSRIDKEGNIRFESEEERKLGQNIKDAEEKLQNFVDWALKPEKKRIPTKPSRAARERRLDEKKVISKKKELRREPKLDE